MTQELGIVLSADYFPVKTVIEVAPMVDQLGYHQVSVPEIWGHDAFSLLSVLAHQTTHTRLATGIVNIFSRSPGTMSMTAASIDELSDGRFILGLGLSGPKVIEDWHGIHFKKPLQRTRDYVELVRMMLGRKRINFESEELGSFKDFKISIRNIRPDIPIHIASIGPKNVQLTAEIADGWIPVIMPLHAFEQEMAKVHSILDELGKNRSSFAITPFVPTLVGTDSATVNTLKGHLAYYFGGMGTFYNNMLARFGYELEAMKIKDEWKKGNPAGAAAAVTDEILDAIAIHGSADQAIEQLNKFYKAGATCPLLFLPFRSTWEQAMTTYQTLAPTQQNL